MRYVILILITITCFNIANKKQLTFKTANGHIVKVDNGVIYYDKKSIANIKNAADVNYANKANRLIEDNGNVFLFITMNGNPNKDRVLAYEITPGKAIVRADAILSLVKDYDGDGYLEFGGSDLTEAYPNPDSMYYIPTAYYEIKRGKIHRDDVLIKK